MIRGSEGKRRANQNNRTKGNERTRLAAWQEKGIEATIAANEDDKHQIVVEDRRRKKRENVQLAERQDLRGTGTATLASASNNGSKQGARRWLWQVDGAEDSEG